MRLKNFIRFYMNSFILELKLKTEAAIIQDDLLKGSL